MVESSLLPDDFEGRFIIISEIDGRSGHIGVHYCGENVHVSCGVGQDALHEADILCCGEEVLDVVDLNFDRVGFTVSHALL